MTDHKYGAPMTREEQLECLDAAVGMVALDEADLHGAALGAARIEHVVIMVDASIAKRWLTRNAKNRKPRQSIVERYRLEMLAGRWHFAGDPIRFDADGNLIDGQHRLFALSELDGISLPLLVVRGLPSEAQGVMDQGVKRTPGDQLGLRGHKNSNALAAAVNRYLTWTNGYLFRDSKVVRAAITSTCIEEWVGDHPTDVANLQSVLPLTIQNDAPPSVAGAACIRFMQIDPAKAVEFFTLLARGAGVEGHPIVTLDKRLQRNRREGLKMPDRDYLSLFILAWNAWRDGRQMAKFQRPRGGSWNAENFPVPR